MNKLKSKDGVHSVQAAELLKHSKEEILARWESIVRQELEGAEKVSEPTLRDSLPKFLDALAVALREENLAGSIRSILVHVAREHASDRASHTDYTIEQVMREYDLLRKVIFEVLEKNQVLQRSARETILDAVTAGMTKATGKFAQVAAEREENIQEQLEETEDLFKTIFDLAAAGKALIDIKTGRFLKVNPKLCELLGYSENELCQKTITQVTHPEDQAWQAELFRSELEKKSKGWSFEKRYMTKQEKPIWVLVSGAPVFGKSGEATQIVSTILDISDRKEAEEAAQRAEEALRDSERQFRTLADSIPQLAWMADSAGYVFWYNQRWYEYSGTTLDEMKGWKWQNVHHPDYVSKVTEKFQEHIKSGEPWEDLFPLRSKNGEWKWFLSRALPLKDTKGKVQRWFGTNTDITREKEFTDMLQEERDMREQFVNTLTHDLRTPLSAIKMCAESLQKSGRDPEKVRNLSDRVIASAIRCDGMIQDLLDANRIRAGQGIVVDIEPCGMQEIVRDAIADLTSIYGDRFELKVNGTFHGYWSPMGIRRMVENLSSNAVKYGTDGGLITISLDDLSDKVRISVHNDGKPIPKDELAVLFDQFRRSKGAEASAAKGWGIGLTIVRGITEAHCGEIAVETSLKKGTTFSITLPRDARPCQEGRLQNN